VLKGGYRNWCNENGYELLIWFANQKTVFIPKKGRNSEEKYAFLSLFLL
jgi:hypothetical protein